MGTLFSFIPMHLAISLLLHRHSLKQYRMWFQRICHKLCNQILYGMMFHHPQIRNGILPPYPNPSMILNEKYFFIKVSKAAVLGQGHIPW